MQNSEVAFLGNLVVRRHQIHKTSTRRHGGIRNSSRRHRSKTFLTLPPNLTNLQKPIWGENYGHVNITSIEVLFQFITLLLIVSTWNLIRFASQERSMHF